MKHLTIERLKRVKQIMEREMCNDYSMTLILDNSFWGEIQRNKRLFELTMIQCMGLGIQRIVLNRWCPIRRGFYAIK